MVWTFQDCPYRYKNSPAYESDEQKLWTFAHEILQEFKKDKRTYSESYELIQSSSFTKQEKKRLNEWLDLVIDDPKTLQSEFEWILEIEDWDILYVLPYHIDNIHELFLSDYKTSKSEWKRDVSHNRQRMCYCLWYFFHDKERDPYLPMPFWFIVLTKHMRWARKQIIKGRYIEAEDRYVDYIAGMELEKLIRILRSLWHAETNNEFPCYENIYCKACPLYKSQTCPHHFSPTNYI